MYQWRRRRESSGGIISRETRVQNRNFPVTPSGDPSVTPGGHHPDKRPCHQREIGPHPGSHRCYQRETGSALTSGTPGQAPPSYPSIPARLQWGSVNRHGSVQAAAGADDPWGRLRGTAATVEVAGGDGGGSGPSGTIGKCCSIDRCWRARAASEGGGGACEARWCKASLSWQQELRRGPPHWF